MKISTQRIKEIQEALERMSQKDNEISHGNIELYDEVIDENSEKLDQIIDEIGWPTRSLLGDVAAAQAWSIATRNPKPETHKKYLELMKASEEMMKEKPYIARFEDQLRVCNGQPELYGTGFSTNEEGKFVPFTVEKEGLNERRKSMNLESYEAFLNKINRLNADFK